MPIRIQRKRTRGWKMPPNTVSVCRPGYWGNPYKVGEFDHLNDERITTPEQAVSLYRERCLSPLMQAHARETLRGTGKKK